MSLISTWSTVANSNGTLGSTPQYWPEGQAPSTVNDCARLMMATIRTQWNDAVWFNWGYTVTRVNGTSFLAVTATAGWNTVALPAAFEANARIKLYDTNTLYGTITTVSASAASTKVTFTKDSGSLTASFTSVANSIIPPTNTPIPGLSIPTDVVTQKTQQIYAVDTGIANAVQISLVPTLNAYLSGQMINFKAAAANTGATTLQVDALGAKTIKKLGGSADLTAGDILTAQMVSVLYDGTNFQMQSEVAQVPTPPADPSKIVQRVSTQTGASATGSTALPIDDTIPQSGEGDQFMSLSITPVDATHILEIRVQIYGSESGAASYESVIGALFQDSGVNAIATMVGATSPFTTSTTTLTFTYVMTAGTTSATTFKVRCGNPTGTFTFNGSGGVRQFGGVLCSGIEITEYTT